MGWLNYHHLQYFWTVARLGSISKACTELRLAQPTISGQLRELERSLGVKLFDRVGRNLLLTDEGQEVYRYADEIFTVGSELQDALKGRLFGRSPRLFVGVVQSLPKLVAYRLLDPALRLPEPVQLIGREGRFENLVAELALRTLDVVLSDTPAGPATKINAYNHLLGECGVSFYGTAKMVAAYRRGFPRSLDDAPFLLPPDDTSLRRSLDKWFASENVRPRVLVEVDDSALLRVFGQSGVGVFVTPSVVEREVLQHKQVRVLGRVTSIRERFYAITVERKLRNPAVAAIAETARRKLFG